MSLEPQAIQVGQCYLTERDTIRRVLRIFPDQRVQYEWRGGHRLHWKVGMLSLREFAAEAARPVPCDWTPESDEA